MTKEEEELKKELVERLHGVEKQWVEDFKTPFEPEFFFKWAKAELEKRKIEFVNNRLESIGNPRNYNMSLFKLIKLIEFANERYTRPTEQILSQGKQAPDSGNVSGKVGKSVG